MASRQNKSGSRGLQAEDGEVLLLGRALPEDEHRLVLQAAGDVQRGGHLPAERLQPGEQLSHQVPGLTSLTLSEE